MKLLFVHQNFPGQYLHLASHFDAQPGNQVVFLTQRKNSTLPGVRKLIYTPSANPPARPTITCGKPRPGC